jgi:hypothetical protein
VRASPRPGALSARSGATGAKPFNAKLVFPVYGVEEIGERSNAFRASQKQKAVRIERVMKNRDHLSLQNRVQVNQYVPATNQLHVGKRRVGKEVLARKNAHVPNGLAVL